jgi:excisionase family DNA binding protein
MSIKIDDDSLFDVPALATALGIKEKTVRKMLSEGQIKGKKLGRKWYVTGTTLTAYFNETNAENSKK